MKKSLITLIIISTGLQTSCANQNILETTKPLQIAQISSSNDEDKDGVDDYNDLVNAARSQIGKVTLYDTSYYSNAFPPPDRGACADVIWRAMKEAGYDFKKALDDDIREHRSEYPSVSDENINFRRVQNIRTYLEKYALKLTKDVIPGDENNLREWQGGDMVTFAQIPGGLWHIAIVSNTRRTDGVPLLIHNYGRGVQESDYLINWPTAITGHYRIKP